MGLEENNKRDFYIRRFEELAERAEKSGCYTYTGFHSPGTVSLAYEVAPERAVAVFGGRDECERAMVRFGDPDEIGYGDDFPIKLICIEPKQQIAEFVSKLVAHALETHGYGRETAIGHHHGVVVLCLDATKDVLAFGGGEILGEHHVDAALGI